VEITPFLRDIPQEWLPIGAFRLHPGEGTEIAFKKYGVMATTVLLRGALAQLAAGDSSFR